jgi:hypothetical protein
VPKLTSGHARRSDLDTVERLLVDAEEQYQARRTNAVASLGVFPENMQSKVLKLAGITEPRALTEQARERLAHLADAKELGVVDVEDGEITITVNAFSNLLGAYGGSKKALLDAAKEAATLCGLARPTSSTQVASSPVLFAATYMATPNQ